MEPEDVNELLQSYNKTQMDEVPFSGWTQKVVSEYKIYSQSWRCVEIVTMIRKDLEYYINLDKTVAKFERINSNFEKDSVVDKKLLNSITC